MIDDTECSITARVPGTQWRISFAGFNERTTARMLAFTRCRGFTDVERLKEPLPPMMVGAEGSWPMYDGQLKC